MSIFKCKMCGGTLEFNPGDTVGVCDSCGTKQTLPRLDDEKKANLYDRANHFRRSNDFDKAMGIYEQILNEDNTDAEAYWSLVLCRYGIEYVEDPTTHKRIPTVNRAQFTSILADEDYKSALQYADGYQKVLYEEEAKAIDDIQKGILAISSKEEPFDVFICYKETDNSGRRTQDSVLANDLYHQLTQEGFKVFFSRITLEDKLGTAYEPYIFAALNSAKVMVVLGTKPECFNAVWVKNEWSRYLTLVKNSGGKKMLIPAYRDMDPYDLPEEFSHLQAQDMSKLGFMQDLIRGIKKIVNSEAPTSAARETVVVSANSASTAPLLERAYLFLEDGKWKDANIYCEKVLDIDPKNAEAYLGKLMAALQVKNRKQLADCPEPFDEYDDFGKAVRFGDEKLETELRGYIAHINERNEQQRISDLYDMATEAMRAAQTAGKEEAFKAAAAAFQKVKGVKDADKLSEKCLEKAEICRKDAIYSAAKNRMGGGFILAYEEAIGIFQTVSGWKDADEQIRTCQRKIEEIKARKEAERIEAEREEEERRIAAEKAAQKRKEAFIIGTPIVCVLIAFIIVLNTVIIPKIKYNKAMHLIDSGEYEEAYAILDEIGNSDAIAQNKYDRAMELIASEDYDSAYALLEESGNRDAIIQNKYDRAMKLIDLGNYDGAYMLLKGLSYKDSEEKLLSIIKSEYERIMMADVGDKVLFGSYEQDKDFANGKEDVEWVVLAKEDNRILLISDKALDYKPYNKSSDDITWENCSLREWLNSTFLDNAFKAMEQALIQSATVSADRYSHNAYPGNATIDKVFLLSITEAKNYFDSDEARRCAPTAYAIAQGASTSDSDTTTDGDPTGGWLLRSPGYYQNLSADVFMDGSVFPTGSPVSNAGCVRPAIWVSLDS